MRKDMFKVIVERPRRGADFRVNRARLSGEDDVPSRISMKRFRALNGTRSKWLNENLAPLKRYLQKQTGRPWRKVYSEICENLDANNTVQQHVRDHLQDFVVVKVAVGHDGQWMNGNERTGWRPGETLWHQPFYIDPNDGILKRSDKLWKKMRLDTTPFLRKHWNKQRALQPNIRRIDASTELHCIDGIWYEIRFRQVKSAHLSQEAYDKLDRKFVWPGNRHAYSKRQLSTTDLVAFKIENQSRV